MVKRENGMKLVKGTMEQIEAMNPTITKWYLDTPIWNQRTNRFYNKLGYIEKSRDTKTIYYQKTICR